MANKASRPALDDDLVDEIAREADVDRRSVIRRLAGLPVASALALIACSPRAAHGVTEDPRIFDPFPRGRTADRSSD